VRYKAHMRWRYYFEATYLSAGAFNFSVNPFGYIIKTGVQCIF
jgi:hypothetical protein